MLTMVLASALSCRPATQPEAPPTASAARIPFTELPRTTLTRRAPSTGSQDVPTAPVGVEVVHYTSGEHELLAWLVLPKTETDTPTPGLVYFHGAFALKPGDVENVRPAVEAGFAVLLPSLRGENGNPGHAELLAGELDDAVAAIDFLAAQPSVDPDALFTLGHSVGGALSALVSLRPDAHVRLTAGVGGIYVPETFRRWTTMKANRALIRFDASNPLEGRLRTLSGNVDDMVRPHHAYIGRQDSWFLDNAATIEGPQFFVHEVAGDHMTSVEPGLAEFVELALADLAAD